MDCRVKPGNDNLKLAPSGLPDGTHSHPRCRITAASTSPRLRGEHTRPSAAVLNAKNADAKHRLWREARRVRGILRRPSVLGDPPSPRPSPRKRGEGAHRVRGAAIKSQHVG